ncbi:anti sigma factor C-terminal domain-containing protein [Lactococcus raffinolactis]|uniref:anti sigma factor C-terminal domain-containing protein n=1 Tax=Pseudolactococcus raffinolactis TaxID=1366 RepID=UPI0039AFC14F
MKLNENFDQLIKKEKRKRLLKTIAISFVTTVVLLFIGFTLINKRMEMQYKKAQEMANITDMIESPNLVSQSQYLSTSGRVTSQLKSERFKNIDGYMVAATPLEINFSLFDIGYGSGKNSSLTVPITKTKEIGAFSRENGEKLPLFFNPKHKESETQQEAKATHEARTLSGFKNHVAEVAISFKEPMTYAEIQAKIPENVLINWYWLGMASDQLSATETVDKVIGINADEAGKLSSEPLKSKTSSAWWSPNYPSFVAAVKTAAEKRSYTVNGLDIYQDALKQIEKYPTLKTAKFSGIIVSGRTENLATLDDEPYVYTTNVGLQAEILPYIEPTK